MSYRDFMKILTNAGFVQIRSGKHLTFSNGVVKISIPKAHKKEIHQHMANRLLREAGIS